MKYYLKLLFLFLWYFFRWEYLFYLVLFLTYFLFVQYHILSITHLGLICHLPYEEYLGDSLAIVVIFLSFVAFYYFMKQHLL